MDPRLATNGRDDRYDTTRTRLNRWRSTIMTSTHDLFYRMEGKLTTRTPIGPVVDGLRADNGFEGIITEGALSGGHLVGMDYFRVRADGVGIIDAHEIIVLGEDRIAVDVTGYVLPPEDLPVPSLEEMAGPDFVWPDTPFAVEAFATFSTAASAYEHLNRVTVVHTGSVNMATGELVIEAWRPRR
jgi:hypothetical protein